MTGCIAALTPYPLSLARERGVGGAGWSNWSVSVMRPGAPPCAPTTRMVGGRDGGDAAVLAF
jgi:hypothetical protein